MLERYLCFFLKLSQDCIRLALKLEKKSQNDPQICREPQQEWKCRCVQLGRLRKKCAGQGRRQPSSFSLAGVGGAQCDLTGSFCASVRFLVLLLLTSVQCTPPKNSKICSGSWRWLLLTKVSLLRLLPRSSIQLLMTWTCT